MDDDDLYLEVKIRPVRIQDVQILTDRGREERGGYKGKIGRGCVFFNGDNGKGLNNRNGSKMKVLKQRKGFKIGDV